MNTLPLPLLFVALLGASAVAQSANRIPPFMKVDGVYILDGNEGDLVKVLELSPETGWGRVQSKAGESWVNFNNITTVTPISREVALSSEMREKADFVREGAMTISAAIDAYAAKHDLPNNASFKWEDIRRFLPAGSPMAASGGKDVTGRPYVFGDRIENHVKVNPETIKECSPVIEDADAYWGKFK